MRDVHLYFGTEGVDRSRNNSMQQLQLECSWDRAVARVARPPGVEAAGHGSNALELVIFPPGTVVPCCLVSFASHTWCHKGTATRPLPTEPWRFPVIPRRTRSSYLCVVVGLLVHMWCECGVRM